MKKLLTISLLLLITVTIFANGNVKDNNTFVNSLPDRHRNYIIPPQPVIPDDDNSTQLNSLPDRHRNYIIPPQPIIPDDDNSTQLNSLPDRHRNYVIPPQPVIPDDDNSTQLNSLPDRRRHNIIPPNPVPPQNPVTISKTIDIKNIGKDVQIHIFNINGLEIKCDVNSLPNGKYFLLIKNGNEIYKEKIVILK